MPTIEITKRLLKRLTLLNLVTPKGLAITPILSGPHGIGKSQIIIKTAKELGGMALVVEGGSLKEGEITGLPFALENDDKTKEVRFIPYFHVANIKKLQTKYYETLKKTGFLSKTLTLTDQGMLSDRPGNRILLPLITDDEKVLNGEDNINEWGNDLPYEIKLELIAKKEILPITLFIDELNRTDPQVMRELMNIILNRNINGYNLPWWVNIVAAINPATQNSKYAVNEFDEAQNDRFLKLTIDANIEEWVEYALKKGLDNDVVFAIASVEDNFMDRSKILEVDSMSPSPRSWEMVNFIVKYNPIFNETSFFSSQEKLLLASDTDFLVRGKVGGNAARTFFDSLRDENEKILPQEILDGKKSKVNSDIVLKFKNMKKIRQKIISDNVARYLGDHIESLERSASKDIISNLENQLIDFISILDPTTTLLFVRKTIMVNLQQNKKRTVFDRFSNLFAKDVIAQINQFHSNLEKMDS